MSYAQQIVSNNADLTAINSNLVKLPSVLNSQEKTVTVRNNNNVTVSADAGNTLSAVHVNVELPSEVSYQQKYVDILNGTLQEYTDVPGVVIDKIRDSQFKNSIITSVVSQQVTSIGHGAFYYATLLTTVDLPRCTAVGTDAFALTRSLQFISIPMCDFLGSGAFRGSGISSLVLPRVDYIAQNCFYSAVELKYLEIGGQEKRSMQIHDNLVVKCYALAHLVVRSTTVPSIMANTFFDSSVSNGTCNIYVPQSLVSAYKSDPQWSKYSAQILAIEDHPEVKPPT